MLFYLRFFSINCNSFLKTSANGILKTHLFDTVRNEFNVCFFSDSRTNESKHNILFERSGLFNTHDVYCPRFFSTISDKSQFVKVGVAMVIHDADTTGVCATRPILTLRSQDIK